MALEIPVPNGRVHKANLVTRSPSFAFRYSRYSVSFPIYRAEAVMKVNAAAIRPQDMDPFSGLFLSRAAVPSVIKLLKTPQVLDQVASNLELASKNQSLGSISGAPDPKTEFFRVWVENTNAFVARDVVNEVARVTILEKETEWARRIARAELSLIVEVQFLEKRIQETSKLLASATDDDDHGLLVIKLGQYQVQYASALGQLDDSQFGFTQLPKVLELVAPATGPGTKIYPTPRKNLISGLIGGIVLGVFLALILEWWDTRVKSPEQVKNILGVPAMAALPVMPKAKDSADIVTPVAMQGEPMLEPYHLLRTNLQSSWEDGRSGTVLVTSADISEGKSTTVSFVGAALAASGLNVILIDADLRRPQLHKFFDIEQSRGLVQLISDTEGRLESYIQETSVENLSLLTAGSRASNPSALFGSERFLQVLEEAKGAADVVLLDSPPVLYSSDALVIAGEVDRVLLVIGAGMLRGDTISRARQALGMVRVKQVDAVLNRVRRDADTYAYYSYYYDEHYRREETG
jgi:capsular exopolysaccharide synthesis family protein